MKRWALVCVASLGVGFAGCDEDYASGADAGDEADVEDNETLAVGAVGGEYGADPESGVFVAGPRRYTATDPAMNDEVVRLGSGDRPARTGRGQVISRGPTWEGGPVVALAGSDAEALALGVSGSEPVVDRAAETGSWLVVAGRTVIAEGPAVAVAWAAREPSDVKLPPVAGNAFVVRLPLALARVPEEVRRVIGAEVRVFDREREVCIARIAGLELEARLVHEAFGPWDPAYSEREVLQRGLRALVATLEPLAGEPDACAGGVVAVGVRAASPRLYLPAVVTPSLRRKAVNAMCGLAAWQRVAAYDTESGGGKPWSPACRAVARDADVRLYETRAGEQLVVVSADGLHAGFKSGDGGLDTTWAHLSDAPVDGVIDMRGDGSPELVLGSTSRAPAVVAGVRFAGDLSEPTFQSDWTPIPPRRTSVGGFAVPDYSVFRAR